ncbi:MAG: indolepyruvate ferredoxin oxidoreductase subunit alpha [Methanotrichaceae archaeon]|nr:indolepyruvate ferredoxin oxidoreductase subunit alpha [Methanotrichaceae archaeon]
MYSSIKAAAEAVDDARVDLVACVPGYPITDLAEALCGARVAVNEKVALEVALGRSASGGRSLVIVKNVGMNLLADPLVISATMTIGAGLVILVGDDIGPEGSQAEMDSRYYGPLSMLPLLDSSDTSSLYSTLIEAFSLSERMRAPAIVRATSGVIKSSEGEPPARRVLAPPAGGFEREIWELTARGRHQRFYKRAFPIACEASESSSLNRIFGDDDPRIGIIASGRPVTLAAWLGYPVLALGYAHPLPANLIRSFLERHELVLVAEEPGPFIESRVQLRGGIFGRLTGDLPQGEVTLEGLRKALNRMEAASPLTGAGSAASKPSSPLCSEAFSPPSHKPHAAFPASQPLFAPTSTEEERALPGRRGICPDCPYLPLYRALASLGKTVAGDAGCSIMAVRDPPAVDMVYGLGSSIGVASGFAEKGIALIGDYALAHSGLQGLINALWQERPVLVVLLENERAAMTGGQMVPSVMPVLAALLPIRSIEMPMAEKTIREILLDEISRPGIGLLAARARCPRFQP